MICSDNLVCTCALRSFSVPTSSCKKASMRACSSAQRVRSGWVLPFVCGPEGRGKAGEGEGAIGGMAENFAGRGF